MKQKHLMLLGFIATTTMFSCTKENPNPTPADTTLQVSIVSNTGSVMSDVTVTLYSSFADWEAKANSLASQTTGAAGKATFTSLSSKKYYFFAEKGCYNNGFNEVSTAGAILANTANTAATTVQANGTLILRNESSHNYSVYINTVYNFDMPKFTVKTLQYKPMGVYMIRVVKTDIGLPSDLSFSGSLLCGGTLTTTWP